MTGRRALHLIQAPLPGFLVLSASVALVAACDGSSTGPDAQGVVFVIEVVDETFRVRIEDPDLIAQARRILAGEEPQKIVTGQLAAGDGGFNDPWSWHILPGTVGFAEAAIELCDGKPSFVEDDLTYWLNTVGTYCPWSAQIIAEEG
jgi:hypothetical protein